jgi:curved DNA-binding protein CbpA
MIDEAAIRLGVLADHIDDVDYYALLEVAHDAEGAAVRDAFHRFALRFHPDQHVGDAASQRRALTIFKRGAEAYRVLLNPTLRARYDHALAAGQKRLPPEAMQAPADTSTAAQVPAPARPFYEKACEALSRGEIANARMHLQFARGRGESPEFDRLAARIDQAERARPGR